MKTSLKRSRLQLFFTIYIFILAFTIIAVGFTLKTASSERITSAVMFTIEAPWDTIDDGVKECFIDALRYAESKGVVFIYRVDSYGGYLDAGFEIGDAALNSKVPTIAYVHRNKALSAGTLIILPADILAVQKYSIIGAMQPITVNPVTGEIVYINESKVLNPIIKRAEAYSSRAGRNVTAVELFIKQALVLNSTEALLNNVADYEVSSLEELLEKVNGRTVVVNGVEYVIDVKPYMIEEYSCSVRSRLISLLMNSYVANVFVTIGLLGTIFALVSGKLAVLPITLLFLLLGLVSVGVSANFISIFLIILGAVLLAVELFVIPGFGIVGISGILLLAFGFALLPAYIPTGVSPSPEYINTVRTIIIVVTAFLASVFSVMIYKVVKVRKKKPVEFTPAGKRGRTVDWLRPGETGFVKVEGEYWRAVSDEVIPPETEVIVVEMLETGVLKVKKAT
ncbi:serine protease [Thermosphaera chiliense]|uniref:Serine protease n=1 Tax=Thermosphaera chiliense TaxID=3402707 RepID=A0A7M1UPZ6_9CREN|nr:NfeD family protein [Thermosphaera aggregans]QOR94059.1 serine protease [Thermosphaera aggregans]